MHMAGRTATGDYWLRLAGPASLHPPSRRYAVSLARFLTALVGFTDWRSAPKFGRAVGSCLGDTIWRPEICTCAGAPAEPLDDSWETTLVERWGPRPRDGWRLERGGDLFEHGQSVFLPDFVFRHESGPTALLEMIGYWTTEYLETRLQALRTIDNPAILLAVAPSDARRLAHLPDAVIPLKSSIPIEAVLQRLRAWLPRRPPVLRPSLNSPSKPTTGPRIYWEITAAAFRGRACVLAEKVLATALSDLPAWRPTAGSHTAASSLPHRACRWPRWPCR